MDRSKTIRPKFRVSQDTLTPEQQSVLDSIVPTPRTFMCHRTGSLVDGGFCAFFCTIGAKEVHFNVDEGIDVTCPFAYNELLGGMGDGAVADS